MRKKWIILSAVLVTLALLAVVTTQAGPLAQQTGSQGDVSPQAELGSAFTYQGQLKADGGLVTDSCEMAFRLYDQGVGGSQVGNALTHTVSVNEGLFTVNLDFGGGVFAGDERWLGIQVQCPGDLTFADLGRQELTAVPYALYAARSGGPENVVTVAKSGGDYTSVQAAIDSIGDAAADNAYLVWIAPGVYTETVVMKAYVHLRGAGQDVTLLTSMAGNSTWPPTAGTVALAANTSLRDLTVGNSGTSVHNAALLAIGGANPALVADVTVRAQGGGTGNNYAIYLAGNSTDVTLLDVTALAENADDDNYGLYSNQAAAATLRGGSFTGRGGMNAVGIHNLGTGTTLDVEGIVARGENGGNNYGLFNYAAAATLRGGSFTAQGGSLAAGIYNLGNAELHAESVTALGENAGTNNCGLYSDDSAAAMLRGGSFTARGGNSARGIYNDRNAVLTAENVAALAEDGSSNYGLCNDEGADAILRGGAFIARGGNSTRGIFSHSDLSYLEATSVNVVGRDAANSNRGLESSVGADVIITQSVLEGASNSIVTTGGGGPVTASNCRLVGGTAQGNVSCTAMSRGTTFNASGCP